MNYFDSPDEIRRRQDERTRERQAELETRSANMQKAQAALTEFAEKMTQLREPVTVWRSGRQGKSQIGIDLTIKGSDGSKVDEIAGWLVAIEYVDVTGRDDHSSFYSIFVTDRGTVYRCRRDTNGTYVHRQLFKQKRTYFVYEANQVDASCWRFDDSLKMLVAALTNRLERRDRAPQPWNLHYHEKDGYNS